jgi:hypothetical protein
MFCLGCLQTRADISDSEISGITGVYNTLGLLIVSFTRFLNYF